MLTSATTRSLLSVTAKIQKSVQPIACRSMTVLSQQSKEEYEKKNYKQRMEKTGRPISPHVQIYAFPIIVFSSGINRVTGCLMTLGCAGLGGIELLGGSGTSLHLMEYIGSQNFVISSFFKFGVSFNILYHFGGGIRHLIWDEMPQYLNNEQGEKSAYFLMGSVTLASLGLAVM